MREDGKQNSGWRRHQSQGYEGARIQQPWATLIATGAKKHEYRSRAIKTPIKDLVVCASKTARDFYPIAGLCYGKAIALVDVTKCMQNTDGFIWWLENPRLIKPFDVHASAAFFYVQNKIEVLPNTREAYEEFILPQAQPGDYDDIKYFPKACFGDREAMCYAFGDDVEVWL